MKKVSSIFLGLSVFLLVIVALNLSMLTFIKADIDRISPPAEWLGYAVAASLVSMLLLHLAGLAHLVRQYWYFKRESWLSSAAMVVGLFSALFILVDVVMLNDIGHEYTTGHDVSGEWAFLFFNHAMHLLFALLQLACCMNTVRQVGRNEALPLVFKDEALFLTVHQIGVCASLLGFLFFGALLRMGIPETYLDGLLFLACVVVLIPYGLSCLAWLMSKRTERPLDWYDEKQFADLSRGALLSLLLSVFAMLGIYFLVSLKLINIDVLVWLPVYFFSTLLVFSGSTLYFSQGG